jgi:hypothetical protein
MGAADHPIIGQGGGPATPKRPKNKTKQKS